MPLQSLYLFHKDDSKVVLTPLLHNKICHFYHFAIFETRGGEGVVIFPAPSLHRPWLYLKALATIPYFKFHFFPHLLIFLQFRDPSCTKLIHQSSPSEIAYLVQDSQIFAVWINFSPGINKFRRVFLEINHVNLDF